MKKYSLIFVTALSLLFSLLVCSSGAQSVPTYNAEGVVVAFKKVNRCPSCNGTDGSIGIAVENWIVRVEKWKDKKFQNTKYILIKYQMYDRSLSESEINKSLKLSLRERLENELNQDCVGNITYKRGEEYFFRPAEFTDFLVTEAGEGESIPSDFKKLPCFIVDRLPMVIN